MFPTHFMHIVCVCIGFPRYTNDILRSLLDYSVIVSLHIKTEYVTEYYVCLLIVTFQDPNIPVIHDIECCDMLLRLLSDIHTMIYHYMYF